MRLFTGIEIPPGHRVRLGLLRGVVTGASWIEPEDYHLTLRFLGDIDGRTADDFVSFIAEANAEPFSVQIKDLGSFGGRHPRVIWAGAEDDGTLARLNALHERAARMSGLEADTRAFVPHVTLARLRNTRPEAVARYLEEQGAFALEPFEVSRIVLFSARPGTGGGPYVVENIFDLAPTDDEESWSDRDPDGH